MIQRLTVNVSLCALLRSPPQPKTSPVSNDGIEPVSPAGANSEPEVQGASYPEQGEQG